MKKIPYLYRLQPTSRTGVFTTPKGKIDFDNVYPELKGKAEFIEGKIKLDVVTGKQVGWIDVEDAYYDLIKTEFTEFANTIWAQPKTGLELAEHLRTNCSVSHPEGNPGVFLVSAEYVDEMTGETIPAEYLDTNTI